MDSRFRGNPEGWGCEKNNLLINKKHKTRIYYHSGFLTGFFIHFPAQAPFPENESIP